MPLTRKQKWRIDKVQSEKIARADKASIKAESELNVNDKEYHWKGHYKVWSASTC